jgi:hypothetical protein
MKGDQLGSKKKKKSEIASSMEFDGSQDGKGMNRSKSQA